jgi:hypothetical protein
MKNKLACDHDRATLGALFAIVGFTFIAVAVFYPLEGSASVDSR